MRRFLHDNSLSIVLLGIFLVLLWGQIAAGARVHNEERQEHGLPPLSLPTYVTSEHFWEATAENWESEFLQMAAFVVLTIFLRQRGAKNSKKMSGTDEVDADPARHRQDPQSPGPVRRGGWVLLLYAHSLTIALTLFFLISFALHLWSGEREYNEEQLLHGGQTVTLWGFLGTAQMWFESFQNWQSEFLSIALLLLCTIYLRQRGSPESKPVHVSHDKTGE